MQGKEPRSSGPERHQSPGAGASAHVQPRLQPLTPPQKPTERLSWLPGSPTSQPASESVGRSALAVSSQLGWSSSARN